MKHIFIALGVVLTLGLNSTINAQQLQTEPNSQLKYLKQQGTDETKILVLLHGYGSNENDLFSFKKYFENQTIYSLRAPENLPGTTSGKYSWYNILVHTNGEKKRDTVQAQKSIEQIVTFLKSIPRKPGQKIILGGFSQGSILSLNIGLKYPELVDGIVGMSGMLFLMDDFSPSPAQLNEYKNMFFFIAHGTKDKIISIEEARKVKTKLNEWNCPVQYKEYPIEHTISGQEVFSMLMWMSTNFGPLNPEIEPEK